MNVLCVNQDPGVRPGKAKGAAVHVQAMRTAFAEQGAEVEAFDGASERDLQDVLSRRFASGRLDLVYERYALGADTACRFAREHDVPHVLEVNSPLLEEAELYRGYRPSQADVDREARLLLDAGTVLAVSEEVADYVRRLSQRTGPILVRPNGVDTRRFSPRGPHDALRAQLAPAGSVVLGFHGRLRPWHGFDLLAHTAAALVRADLPVFVLAVGVGDFATALAKLPRERWRHVEWVAHEDVGRYVACFDVLPLTYAKDGPTYFSPLKLMEAMACGVVPVVPAAGQAGASVRHEQEGLVYPAGDAPALERALRRSILDEPLRARLGAAAVELARERSWNAIAAELLELASSEELA